MRRACGSAPASHPAPNVSLVAPLCLPSRESGKYALTAMPTTARAPCASGKPRLSSAGHGGRYEYPGNDSQLKNSWGFMVVALASPLCKLPARASHECPESTKVACATPGMLSLPVSPHILKAYPILASAEALAKRSGHRQLRTHAQATGSCALMHEIESFCYRCILLSLAPEPVVSQEDELVVHDEPISCRCQQLPNTWCGAFRMQSGVFMSGDLTIGKEGMFINSPSTRPSSSRDSARCADTAARMPSVDQAACCSR